MELRGFLKYLITKMNERLCHDRLKGDGIQRKLAGPSCRRACNKYGPQYLARFSQLKEVGILIDRENWRNLVGLNIVIQSLSVAEEWTTEKKQESIIRWAWEQPEWTIFNASHTGKTSSGYLRCLLVLEPAMRYDYLSLVQHVIEEVGRTPSQYRPGCYPVVFEHWIHDALDLSALECVGKSKTLMFLLLDPRFKLKTSLMNCMHNGNETSLPLHVSQSTDLEVDEAIRWAFNCTSPLLPVLLQETIKQNRNPQTFGPTHIELHFPGLEDRGLELIPPVFIPSITYLNLSSCDKITWNSLKRFSNASVIITSLPLRSCPLTEEMLWKAAFRGMLTSESLSNICEVIPPLLNSQSRSLWSFLVQEKQSWIFHAPEWIKFIVDSWDTTPGAWGLRTVLDTPWCNFELDLSSSGLDQGLVLLSGIPLQGLKIKATEEGLRCIAAVTSLTHLHLLTCRNEDLNFLCSLQNLTSLSLTSRLVTGLQHLKPLTKLQTLTLICENITDEASRCIKLHPSLTHVDLSACQNITWNGLKNLPTQISWTSSLPLFSFPPSEPKWFFHSALRNMASRLEHELFHILKPEHILLSLLIQERDFVIKLLKQSSPLRYILSNWDPLEKWSLRPGAPEKELVLDRPISQELVGLFKTSNLQHLIVELPGLGRQNVKIDYLNPAEYEGALSYQAWLVMNEYR